MRRTSSTATSVMRFGLAGMAAVLCIGALTLFAVARVSREQAMTQAIDRTRLAAFGVIEPVLSVRALIPKSPEYLALDEVVQNRILSEPSVVRVKIWSADGMILYSDEPKLVGRTFPAKDDHLRVLRDGGVEAEESNTSAPENIFERNAGRMLEVYLAVRLENGQQVVYEQYERYSDVSSNSRRLLGKLALPFGVGLGLLWFLQLPLARSLVRRVRSAEKERAVLLERAVTASARERERIAADLHDGVVQDLAGLTFELAAAVPQAKDPTTRQSLMRSSELARQTMVRLRSSLVDLHPPSAHSLGLGAAINELAQPLHNEGVAVEISVDRAVNDGELNAEAEALLYRVAQESLRNVSKHAGAKKVDVRVTANQKHITMTICDDGKGFDASAPIAARADGHLGMELQRAMIRRHGGSTTVDSKVGSGTTITVELPRDFAGDMASSDLVGKDA